MAGQPQEPSWQPAAPDQAREAWPPPPSFTPQPGAAQETFAYPPPPGYGQQAQPGPGYPPPTYTPPAYDPGGQDQAQAFAPAQGPAQIQDPGMPQWQASPGRPPAAAPRPRGEKGFIGSLFDFSFQSMVTPKIIKVLYILLTVFVGLWALLFTLYCFKHAGALAGFFVLIILDPIYILLTLGVYRIVFEFIMVTFRLHDDVKALRARAEAKD